MAKFKDWFGNATKEFNHTLRGQNVRTNVEPTLMEQLEQFGTPSEKAAIQNLKLNGKMPKRIEKSTFNIDPWS